MKVTIILFSLLPRTAAPSRRRLVRAQDGGRAARRTGLRRAARVCPPGTCTTSGQLKIATRDCSKTAGRTPIFEARIVFYDQIWV